jgi:hypothetical protein
MKRILESPLACYLIIGAFSLFAAWLMFQIGGSLAEVSGQEGSALGFTFKAGGAFAGFLIVFLVSPRFLERLRASDPGRKRFTLKLELAPGPTKFDRTKSYKVSYRLFDIVADTKQEVSLQDYTWENGFLTVYAHDVGENDMIKIRIEQAGQTWESEDFQSRTRETNVKPL